MQRIDPKYFEHMYLLELIRLGKTPACLDAPQAKQNLLNWLLAILGAT